MKQNRKKAAKKESFFTKLINKIEDDLINIISKLSVWTFLAILLKLVLNLCPSKLIKLLMFVLELYNKH